MDGKAGKRNSLPEVGVSLRSRAALVGRVAPRGRGLRAAAGAGAAARTPPPRGAQCQAGGDSGWKLRGALQRGLRRRRRRLRHLGPGEQRAPGGAAGKRAGRADAFSQRSPGSADRSWRGVGKGRVYGERAGVARGGAGPGAGSSPGQCAGGGGSGLLPEPPGLGGGSWGQKPLGLRRAHPGPCGEETVQGRLLGGPEPSWPGEEPRGRVVTGLTEVGV